MKTADRAFPCAANPRTDSLDAGKLSNGTELAMAPGRTNISLLLLLELPVIWTATPNRPALIPAVGTRAGLSFWISWHGRVPALVGDRYYSESQSLVQKLFFSVAFF